MGRFYHEPRELVQLDERRELLRRYQAGVMSYISSPQSETVRPRIMGLSSLCSWARRTYERIGTGPGQGRRFPPMRYPITGERTRRSTSLDPKWIASSPSIKKRKNRARETASSSFRSELLVHFHLERITLVLGRYRAQRVFLGNLIFDLDNVPLSRSEVRGKCEK